MEESSLKTTPSEVLTSESVVSTDEEGAIIDISAKMEKADTLLSHLVPPHKTLSREVLESDVERVLTEAYVLRDLCIVRNGIYGSAYAMAHPQIDDKDPLRFFVFQDGRIIINPKITLATKFQVDSKEGCMSYPDRVMTTVGRSHKIDVEYQTLVEDGEKKKLSPIIEGSFSGRESKIFQHEIDHFDAKYVYDKLIEAEKEKEHGTEA